MRSFGGEMGLASFLALFLTLGPSPGLCQIQITDNGSGFTVSFNGLDLLLHDQVDKPLFSVGKGVFEAVYDMGNYDVNDTVTEKYALDEYDFGNLISLDHLNIFLRMFYVLN